MNLDTLSFKSATEAAEAIQLGNTSSTELTTHILERIKHINPRLNSIITPQHEQALKRAGEADKAQLHGEYWGPLHGVPVTVKDQYEIKGVPTTCGSPIYADHIPERNAVIVNRLLDAGAIIIAHTNVPELIADWQTYNKIHGTTVNPWNHETPPGGSSGGCAASVATGLTYLSIGSDFAGSIRVPAHFTGVYGHRPSIGTVPLRGSVPDSMNSIHRPPSRMSTPGPLARSPADLRLAMEVIGGPDQYESTAYTWNMPPPRHRNLEDYRIGYIIDEPRCPLSQETRKPIQETINQLKDKVHSAQEGWPNPVDPAEQFHLFKLLRYADKAAQLKDKDLEETRRLAERPNVDDEALKAWVWTTEHRHHIGFEEKRIAVRCLWQKIFKDIDVFLMPVNYTAAFPHDHSEPMTKRTIETSEGERPYMDQLYWMTYSSITGLPCTVAPAGFTDTGLPVGIQILGPYLEDGTTIHFAELLEKVTGGYTEPLGYRI